MGRGAARLRALVTGGGGFLGTALCRKLREQDATVTSFSRGDYPHLREWGVKTVRGDLSDRDSITNAVRDHDIVFHVAAKAGVWGKRNEYFESNVRGTEHVVAACRASGVARLVHTSSPSVCFDGNDHRMAASDLPYAESFLADYPESKALAEQMVLAENGPNLATCALRPHLIFGPGDPHLLPRLIATAKSGKLAVVGDGRNEVTLCYVENAAQAHLIAGQTLDDSAPHAGRAYFIGQEEPVNLWQWLNKILKALDIPQIKRTVSQNTAYRVGAVLELVWKLFRLSGEPRMTRFVATQLATTHTYTMKPARDDFGYSEEIDIEEATQATLEWLKRTR
ncbi:MAG: nucleoside-diphosphate-sugar epimerase [Planctomycetota bacterium]|jgi:nucleoside-diphosphate-sugar epimerase